MKLISLKLNINENLQTLCTPQKQASVQETTMISNLWKWAHLERSVFHVIKLSAFSWPLHDLWCQMLVKVIQHFNKIPSFSPHTSSLSDADLNHTLVAIIACLFKKQWGY